MTIIYTRATYGTSHSAIKSGCFIQDYNKICHLCWQNKPQWGVFFIIVIFPIFPSLALKWYVVCWNLLVCFLLVWHDVIGYSNLSLQWYQTLYEGISWQRNIKGAVFTLPMLVNWINNIPSVWPSGALLIGRQSVVLSLSSLWVNQKLLRLKMSFGYKSKRFNKTCPEDLTQPS